MNKFIKEQLSNVRSCNIEFCDDTTSIFIKKTTQVLPSALNIGDICLIELNDRLLLPNANSTLETNWNAGKIPKYKHYKVELLEVINNMYKFNGIGIENSQEIYSENWYGWFPSEYFTILEKY